MRRCLPERTPRAPSTTDASDPTDVSRTTRAPALLRARRLDERAVGGDEDAVDAAGPTDVGEDVEHVAREGAGELFAQGAPEERVQTRLAAREALHGHDGPRAVHVRPSANARTSRARHALSARVFVMVSAARTRVVVAGAFVAALDDEVPWQTAVRSAQRLQPALGSGASEVADHARGGGLSTASPWTIGLTATTGRAKIASRTPGSERIGSIETYGFEGPITTSSARARASRTPAAGGGQASKRTRRTGGCARWRTNHCWNRKATRASSSR